MAAPGPTARPRHLARDAPRSPDRKTHGKRRRASLAGVARSRGSPLAPTSSAADGVSDFEGKADVLLNRSRA